MRNLKRTLSLVLAAAMLIGMMVVSASAADFTDKAEIDNTEAVDVMVALGVINGKGDGSTFDPDGTLTRAEAAKIITYMLMGPTNAEKLGTTGTSFTDVPANHWAAPYIGYCASLNILAGVGDGSFNPEGELTGIAFGKMLLTALGYDAAIEGYVNNANWSTNIAVDMVDAGLDVTGIVLSAPISRDNACQMAFQALTATMVKYSNKGSTVTIGGVDIVTGASSAEVQTWKGAEGYDYKGTVSAASETIEFCEKYFSGLKWASQADSLERPGHTWTYDGKTYGSYANTAKYSYAVAKAVDSTSDNSTATTQAAVRTATGNNNLVFDGTTSVYVNGNIVSAWNQVVMDLGDTVELFLETDGKTVDRVVITRESAAKIVNVTANTGKATVTIDGVKTVYNYNIYIDTVADGNLDGNADITITDLELAGYTSDYVKGTYLTVVQKNSSILSSKVATPVQGAVTTFVDGVSIAIDGTTYTYANSSVIDPGTFNWTAGVYEVVKNSNGNALYVGTVSGAVTISDIVYTNGTVWCEGSTAYGSASGKVMLQVVYMDGTVENVVVGQYTGTDGSTPTLITGGYDNEIQLDSTSIKKQAYTAGMYSVATVPASSTYASYKTLTSVGTGGTLKATNSDTLASDTILSTSDKKFGSFYTNSDTVYLLITGSNATTKATVYTGGIGYAYDASEMSDFVLYTTSGSNNVATAVIINGTGTALTSNEVLYMGGTTSVSNGASTYSGTLYGMDGSSNTYTLSSTGGKGFWTYTKSDAGVYTLVNVDTAITDVTAGNYVAAAYVNGAYFEDVKFVSSYYDNYLSISDGTDVLADIDATNATVIDLRTDAAKAANYNATIASIADLDIAAATYYTGTSNANVVTISLYVTNNGAQVIFVNSVSNS